jgi:hypothetical protein
MDFKIKIDLSSHQSIINDLPTTKDKKKKKAKADKTPTDKSSKKKPERITEEMPKKKSNKKVKKLESAPNTETKTKINTSGIISLSLPNNDNLKGDQAQKLNMITKKKPRHWEKRWVLVPNVFEFTKEIWLKKWVLVDGEDDIIDNDVYSIFI